MLRIKRPAYINGARRARFWLNMAGAALFALSVGTAIPAVLQKPEEIFGVSVVVLQTYRVVSDEELSRCYNRDVTRRASARLLSTYPDREDPRFEAESLWSKTAFFLSQNYGLPCIALNYYSTTVEFVTEISTAIALELCREVQATFKAPNSFYRVFNDVSHPSQENVFSILSAISITAATGFFISAYCVSRSRRSFNFIDRINCQ